MRVQVGRAPGRDAGEPRLCAALRDGAHVSSARRMRVQVGRAGRDAGEPRFRAALRDGAHVSSARRVRVQVGRAGRDAGEPRFRAALRDGAHAYGSSFVAERVAGIAEFLLPGADGPDTGAGPVAALEEDERLLPVTRSILALAGACRLPSSVRWRCRDLSVLTLVARCSPPTALLPSRSFCSLAIGAPSPPQGGPRRSRRARGCVPVTGSCLALAGAICNGISAFSEHTSAHFLPSSGYMHSC